MGVLDEAEVHGINMTHETLQLTASLLCDLPFKAAQKSSQESLKSGQYLSWIAVHPAKSAVLVGDRTRVQLVDVLERDGAKNADQKAIQTQEQVQAMAFSACGEFLALADASGVLSLYKSSGTLLFGHRILREASDSVVSFKFSSSECRKSSCDAQELVVATELGVLLRLGDLRLAEFEKLLLVKPKEALSEILRTIRFGRTNVGRLKDGAQSCMLIHRFQSEEFVVLANHGAFVSVWKTEDGEKHTGIEKVAMSDSRSAVVEAMDFDADYSSLVILCEGKLSWWNWRDMTELFEADMVGVMSFVVIRNHEEDEKNSTTSLLAVATSSEAGSSVPSFQLVQVSHTGTHSTVVSRLKSIEDLETDAVYRDVKLFASSNDSTCSRCQALAACQTDRGVILLLLSGDRDIPSSTTDQSFFVIEDGDMTMDEDAVSIAESLLDVSMSTLVKKGVLKQYQAKLEVCTSSIGESDDETRVLFKHLFAIAASIRKYTSSSPRSSLSMASLLQWCDEISELSYKWTTFQLLGSSSTAQANGKTLRDKWQQFRAVSVVELLEKYIKVGCMRAVRILWSRHVDDATVRSIDKLLECLPTSLPVSAYASWIQNEVVSVVIHYSEQAQSCEDASMEAGTEPLLDQVAIWLLKRAEDAAAKDDLDTAIRICSLLKHEDGEDNATLFFYEFKLHTSTRSGGTELNVFERIERLTEKLRHVKYLAVEHRFNISLSVFEEETPATIAMSLLDRVLEADSLKEEVEQHVRKYLGFCGVEVDPVLHDYVTELAESIQTPQSAEEARALVLLDDISDANVRADAALALLRATLPPYSNALKEYAHNCTQWKTERREELEEHVRLMEIQDMLTKYDVKQFDIADTKSASRLVSHILNQVSTPSAFVDAMLLVDAYSGLRCDRAVVGFTENLLADCDAEMMLDGLEGEVSVKVVKAMDALDEVKKRRDPKSNVMLYVALMEEIIEFGVTLLELEAEERSDAHEDVKRSFILSMLKALVAVYLPELKTLLELAGISSDDSINAYVESSDYLLCDVLLSDLQRICQVEAEFGLLLSLSTLRDPEQCEAKLKQLIKPDILFDLEDEQESTQELTAAAMYVGKGKGKKRALGSNRLHSSAANKRQRIEPQLASQGLQRGDERTRLLFDLNRFASVVGIDAKACRSLVAQSAAKSGAILQAARFSRELFSKRANKGSDSSEQAEALKKTAISLSLYTSSHVKEIYDTPMTRSQQHLPAQAARVQAPMYTLELLRYALCMCAEESFDETLILFKNAMLVHEVLQFTQHNVSNDKAPWPLYHQWYRGDACALSSYESMKLVTRFAIAEHKNLRRDVEFSDTIASKRYVSYLVEQRADLLSLQALMSMQELPEDAAMVLNTQMGKLLSSVFQSQEIDNYLALGLMLSLKQEDAFNAFRRQISRENVAKDFNRFQKLALIGADAARAWQQIAFLHQCIELEGNARWWHYLSLLGIECDHKAFQSERRDLQYIRRLVPQLITRSNYDFYTVLEFTRHYQIDDSYPSLVYTEALLLEDSATTNLEYQDKIAGVIDEIHEQHLVKLLLKSIPRISGQDYDRLLFIFRLLLDNTSYRERQEVKRRVEVLRHVKAFAASQREEKMSFHELITKPREVLSRLVTKENFTALLGLVEPLRMEPDELQMLLLKNMITSLKLKTPVDGETRTKFSAFEDILACLSDTESRVTAAEWLAENFPLGDDKLKALEFALKAAVTGQSESKDLLNTSFTGYEAQTRLETKILRVKVEMLLRNADSQTSSLVEVINDKEQTSQLLALVTEPKQLYHELYRRYALSFYNHSSDMLHTVASSIGDLLHLPQDKLRLDLVREWLVKDSLHIGREDSNEETKEDPFELLKEERLHQIDEDFVRRILYVTSACVKGGVPFGDQVLGYLVDFAKDSTPRAGVTFRAKMRALCVILRLGQLYHSAVERFVSTKYGVDNTDTFFKELLQHTKHCAHMVAFEAHRVPYDMSRLLKSDKETLTRSFLRRFPPLQPWVLRCASRLMLDFEVAALDLWEDVLTNMLRLEMVRSLAALMDPLSRKSFVRSLSCGRHVWEEVLTSSIIHLKVKHNHLKSDRSLQDRDEAKGDDDILHFCGIPVSNVRSAMQRTANLLERCPFLDQIDVAAFLVHLRDLTAMAEEEPDGAEIVRQLDLNGFAVKFAMVIPNPEARFEALVTIIHAGAYNSVLHELPVALYFLDGEKTIDEESGDLADNFRLIQESFSEAAKRKDYSSILGTALEPGFVEYLAATGDIDHLLSLSLEDKRMETAFTAVELYYEYHPSAATSVKDTKPNNEKGEPTNKRRELIDAYLASSKSIHLERFRAS